MLPPGQGAEATNNGDHQSGSPIRITNQLASPTGMNKSAAKVVVDSLFEALVEDPGEWSGSKDPRGSKSVAG